jgi:hypothetical protein
MGGNAQQQQFGSSYTQYSPQILQAIQAATGQFQNSTQQFGQQAQNAAGQIGTDYKQYTPNVTQYDPHLNTNFAQPNFPTTLDAFSQNLVSQGAQNSANSLNATNQQLSSQYGNNAGLLGALQSQAAINNQLQQNPMMFQGQPGAACTDLRELWSCSATAVGKLQRAELAEHGDWSTVANG